MPDFIINQYGPNPQITVGTALDRSRALTLVGHGVTDYGQAFAENTIRHLSNFANSTEPRGTPLVGQLWFDTTTKSLRIWGDSSWNTVFSQGSTTKVPAANGGTGLSPDSGEANKLLLVNSSGDGYRYVTLGELGLSDTTNADLSGLTSTVNGLSSAIATITTDLAGKANIHSPTLTGSPQTTSPERGNASLRIATTAFVRDIGWSASTVKTITAGESLTAADLGATIAYTGSSSISVYLPLLSTASVGDKIEILHQGTDGLVSIHPTGTNTLMITDGEVVSAVQIPSVGSAVFVRSGSSWVLSGGTARAVSGGDGLVGMVAYFPRNTPPAGWLVANGATISRTTYRNLFNTIGTTFGTGDGSTTFAIPDLRGEFLRGWDNGRGLDSGRIFGSVQGSQNLSHSHTGVTTTDGNHQHGTSWGEGSSHNSRHGIYNYTLSTGSGSSDVDNRDWATSLNGAHTHTLTINSEGGSETRPRNIALLACIKY